MKNMFYAITAMILYIMAAGCGQVTTSPAPTAGQNNTTTTSTNALSAQVVVGTATFPDGSIKTAWLASVRTDGDGYGSNMDYTMLFTTSTGLHETAIYLPWQTFGWGIIDAAPVSGTYYVTVTPGYYYPPDALSVVTTTTMDATKTATAALGITGTPWEGYYDTSLGYAISTSTALISWTPTAVSSICGVANNPNADVYGNSTMLYSGGTTTSCLDYVLSPGNYYLPKVVSFDIDMTKISPYGLQPLTGYSGFDFSVATGEGFTE